MGFGAFIILCIVVCVLAWVGSWVIGQLAPGHPAIVDRIIWIAAVVIIAIALLQATGIMSHDPQIPKL